VYFSLTYWGADKSLAWPGRKQTRKHIRDARDFNNIETRAVIKFLFLQDKAPKEIHAILTETLSRFLPAQAKELSAPLYSYSVSYSEYWYCIQGNWYLSHYRGADKSLARPGRKQTRKHVRDARDFNNIETWAVIKYYFRLHLTADWLAPRVSDCSRMRSEVSSDWLPGYVKATRPVLEIFKMDRYFPDSPRRSYVHFLFPQWI